MDYSFLTGTELFDGIQTSEMPELLSCVSAHERAYQKDALIRRAGDRVREIGLVESGSVNTVVNIYKGGSNILSHTKKGEIFAENYAAVPESELLCDVIAAEDCRILFLDMEKLLSLCSQSCSFHLQLIRNLLRISAGRNIELSARMLHIAPKTIRERLLSYFSEQATASGGSEFTIPFSRQQLADYLSVDRSALSNELSKMQKEGLIRYHKNTFSLL